MSEGRGLRRLLGEPSVVRYVVVGLLTVAVEYGLLVGLTRGGVGVYLAATVGFWVSLLVNFVVNKLWTFGVRPATGHHLAFYAVLVALNYATGLGLIALARALGLDYLVGKVAATCLTTGWNYLLYKHVVFVDRERAWFGLRARATRTTGHEGVS